MSAGFAPETAEQSEAGTGRVSGRNKSMTGDWNECRLCPRNCGADRSVSGAGVCGESSEIRVARAALHFWEEPCLSGERGAGAIFFSGCSLRCVYCQNRSIALGKTGKTVSKERLAEIMLELQEQGACNIDLVTPTHFMPGVIEAVRRAKAEGLVIPILYNTSGYESAESLKRLEGLADIYLPDFKYLSSERSRKYSKAADYPETAAAALAEMFRQTGKPVFDEEGLMRRGIIVRHLVLPGGVHDAKRIIRYLHETYGDDIYISIMNQYTPMPGIEKEFPELGRRLTEKEYDHVVDYAIDLGVQNAFIQEGETCLESFIPEFDGSGV